MAGMMAERQAVYWVVCSVDSTVTKLADKMVARTVLGSGRRLVDVLAQLTEKPSVGAMDRQWAKY